jgi:hypothetical protein
MGILGWIGAVLFIAAGAGLGVPWSAHRRRLQNAGRRLDVRPGHETFSEEMLAGLPDPARRYLRHAIRPGAVLASQVRLTLQAGVKIRKTDQEAPYRTYRFEEVLTAGRGLWGRGWVEGASLPKSASFWYSDGDAAGRDALLDVYPTLQNSGAEFTRVLKSRFLYELTWIPTAFLPQRGARWEALDDERARVMVELDGEIMTLELRVDADGRLLEAAADRWGSVGNAQGHFSYIPFGMAVDEEKTFGDYTIPTILWGGWWYRTERYVESTRAIVETADFR